MRGAGIYGGRAPTGVGMSQETFTQAMDEAAARREAEDQAAYERAREARSGYEAEGAEDEAQADREAGS
jgi:hypothetical protein